MNNKTLKYDIMIISNLMVIKNKQEINRSVDLITKSAILDILKSNI